MIKLPFHRKQEMSPQLIAATLLVLAFILAILFKHFGFNKSMAAAESVSDTSFIMNSID